MRCKVVFNDVTMMPKILFGHMSKFLCMPVLLDMKKEVLRSDRDSDACWHTIFGRFLCVLVDVCAACAEMRTGTAHRSDDGLSKRVKNMEKNGAMMVKNLCDFQWSLSPLNPKFGLLPFL